MAMILNELNNNKLYDELNYLICCMWYFLAEGQTIDIETINLLDNNIRDNLIIEGLIESVSYGYIIVTNKIQEFFRKNSFIINLPFDKFQPLTNDCLKLDENIN